MCHCRIWKAVIWQMGPRSLGCGILKALVVQGSEFMWLNGILDSSLFKRIIKKKKKMGLFHRLFNLPSFLLQNWAAPMVLAFMESGATKRYNQWTLECSRPISLERQWCPVDRFTSVERAQSTWLTSTLCCRCPAFLEALPSLPGRRFLQALFTSNTETRHTSASRTAAFAKLTLDVSPQGLSPLTSSSAWSSFATLLDVSLRLSSLNPGFLLFLRVITDHCW